MEDKMTMHLDATSLAIVNQQLNQLMSVERSEVVTQGLREGARIISEKAKSNIQTRLKKKTGNLLSSVGIQVKKKTGRAYAGYKRPQGAHAHILDKGTKKRYTAKGVNRGSVKPYLFHTDAVEQMGDRALNTLMESITKSINKIVNR